MRRATSIRARACNATWLASSVVALLMSAAAVAHAEPLPNAASSVAPTAWADTVRASLATQAVEMGAAPASSGSSSADESPRTSAHPVTAWARAVEARLALHAHRVADAGRDALAWSERGMASWYGNDHSGRRTSSGDRFNPMQLTCAHPTLPLGTKVLVTSETTGRSVVVTVNDRGPYGNRIVDLSRAAAARIGMLGSGVADVTLQQATPDVVEVAQADAADTSEQAIDAADPGQDAADAVSPPRHGRQHRRLVAQ